VKAIVVPKKGEVVTEEEIIEHCRRHLASYKKPTSVAFVDELPKSPLGKVLKKELRARFVQ
ncbi:MAG: long-chain fatty acid--CoA ligase, partial [Candidatus Bathyarchaeia archaeon]